MRDHHAVGTEESYSETLVMDKNWEGLVSNLRETR